MEWENRFANLISQKVLVSRIYKELFQVNNKKTTTFGKWAKDLNKYFSKGDMQTVKKHM